MSEESYAARIGRLSTLTKEPGWSYGDILPLRQRAIPFAKPRTELAIPEIVRGPLQGVADMLQIPGQTYAGQVSQAAMPEAAIRVANGIMGAGMGGVRPKGALGMGGRSSWKWRANGFHPDDEALAAEIAAALESSPHSYHGLRIDQDVEHQVGDYVPNSRAWVDGSPTDDLLNGASGMSVDDPKSIKNVLDALSPYLGDNLTLIGGDSASAGEDAGEIIIRHGRSLGSWSNPRNKR